MESTLLVWKNIFQEIVGVSNCNPCIPYTCTVTPSALTTWLQRTPTIIDLSVQVREVAYYSCGSECRGCGLFKKGVWSTSKLRGRKGNIPIKSTITDPPKSTDIRTRIHGRYGAWKANRPKKLYRTYGFRLHQMYTIMVVRASPRNIIRTATVAMIWSQQ